LTFDISVVICTKQNLNYFRGPIAPRAMADNTTIRASVLFLK
jgi:hypothetical protein